METDEIKNQAREWKNELKNEAKDVKNEIKSDLRKRVGTNPERREGPVARAIENQTARIPSDAFLWTSAGAMACSLTLKLLGKDHLALFIGQWAAPFLLFGLYNKIVKINGNDQAQGLAGSMA